jgi:hypothetical protein
VHTFTQVLILSHIVRHQTRHAVTLYLLTTVPGMSKFLSRRDYGIASRGPFVQHAPTACHSPLKFELFSTPQGFRSASSHSAQAVSATSAKSQERQMRRVTFEGLDKHRSRCIICLFSESYHWVHRLKCSPFIIDLFPLHGQSPISNSTTTLAALTIHHNHLMLSLRISHKILSEVNGAVLEST